MRPRLATGALLGVLVAVVPFAHARAFDLAAAVRDAPPGATISVPAGVHAGLLRLEKPLTLAGSPGAIIEGGTSGDILECAAPGITLRGLTFRATGIDLDKENCAVRVLAEGTSILDCAFEDVLFGIDAKNAPRSVIRGNTIRGKALDVSRRGDTIRLWRCDDSVIEDNTITAGRDAVLWYSVGIAVRRNTVTGSRYGFHLMYSDRVTLEHNTLRDNSVGVYFMYSKELTLRENTIVSNRGPSGFGIGLKDVDDYTIEHNTIAGNRVGVYIDGSPFRFGSTARLASNTIACNDQGLAVLPNARGNKVWANAFLDNIEQVAVLGRGELKDNEFDDGDRGNFWSDYPGYDADGDGVGETPYASAHLFEDLMAREPALRLFLFSPAQRAVEFMARAVPAVRPEPKFTDWCPLTQPPPRRQEASPTHAATYSGLASMLAGVSGLVLVAGFAGEWRARRRYASPGEPTC